MATKRGGDKSKYELVNFQSRKRDEFLQRFVLPTDTLQGLSLLYNTTVAELKKLNNLHTESDLHARRVLKVPSRGILINLDPNTVQPPLLLTPDTRYLSSDDEETKSNNGQEYLSGKDSIIQEIREKAENDAARSPILTGPEDPEQIRIHNATLDRAKKSSLKWWHIFLPCLCFILIFPIAVFLFQEHIHHFGDASNHSMTLFSTDNHDH